MYQRCPLALLFFIMLSSAVKAFSLQRSRHVSTGSVFSRSIARSMSSPTEEEGQISVVERCREKISTLLGTDDVTVTGAFDDPNGSHISIKCVSQLFEGKRPVARQQMVYKALWEELQGPVHAVDSMVCKTPSEK